MKYKIAIFDMDGTILNTLDDLADSMNHCLRARGLAERSLQEIRTFLGERDPQTGRMLGAGWNGRRNSGKSVSGFLDIL